MEARYQIKLPARLRTLVDEIETAAGSEIEVRRAPGLEGMRATLSFGAGTVPWHVSVGPPMPGHQVRMSLDCGADFDATDRCYPKPYAMVAHELLHLRRYVVENVPTVFHISGVPQAPGIFSVQGMEQAIEHAVIEPRVKHYVDEYPLRFCCREVWDTVPPRDQWEQPFVMRWLCLDEWVKVRFENSDAGILEHAEQVMAQVGLLDDARSFTDGLRAAIAMPDPIVGKERMAALACVAYRIPKASMSLLHGGTELRPISNQEMETCESI